MRREEAEMSPFRNVITRSIGAAPNVAPDFYEERAVPGDIWVLCSDGLTGHVQENEILFIAGQQPPSEAARQLIELANARGGRDNITVFIIAVRELLPVDAQSETMQTIQSFPSSDTPMPASASSAPVQNSPTAASLYTAPSVHPDLPRPGWRKIFGR